MALGHSGQPFLQASEEFVNRRDLVTHKEAHIQQDLIVAAAGRMQLAAERADFLREPPLNGHMDIFVRR